MQADTLLTIPQTGTCLGVSRSTVYILLKQGRLPSVKIGRARRIRESDLAAYIEKLADEAVAQ